MIRLLEAVMPGLRDARAPLVAGLVWLLVAWLLAADYVPERTEARGFTRQAYEVSSVLGTGPTLTAVAIAAYLIGVLGVSLAQALSAAVASVHRWVVWQNRARLTRNLKQQDLAKATAQHADGIRQQLAQFSRAQIVSFASLPLRRTRSVVSLVHGDQPTRARALAVTVAANAWHAGQQAEVERLKLPPAMCLDWDPETEAGWHVEELLDKDLGGDISATLRALDETLYQAHDRERAEREFRIAVMPPVLTVCMYGSMTWTTLLVPAALAAATFCRVSIAAVKQDDAAASAVLLKGIALPNLRAAERAGRMTVARFAKERSAAVVRQSGPPGNG
ncbi:MAG: hypothetical protein AB7I50_19460 [Vicinamibacterales bacterium]